MVRIRVLGALALEVEGVAAAPPAGRPAQALLGWLALHPGTHARSEVAGRLWPDVLESSARASLRNALSGVRRALGPAADRVLIAGRETVGLAGEPEAWVDASAFDALIAAGEHERRLRFALAICWPALAKTGVLAARDVYRDRRGRALAALADGAESAGALEQAIRYSRERVALDPFDEPAHRDLIVRLAVSDRAGAIALYERLAERMRRELGVAVSPQTRALVDRVRSGQLDHAVAPAETRHQLRQEGGRPRHRCRARSSRGASGLSSSGAPMCSPGSRRCGGRSSRGSSGWRSWPGEPGIGKTRLLAEFAATVQAAGAGVLYGRAEEDALLPYQPFADAVRGALEWGLAVPDPDTLAAVLPGLTHRSPRSASLPEEPPAGRLRLFEAVRGSVEAARDGAAVAAGARRPALGRPADAAAARVPGEETAASAGAPARRLPADRAHAGSAPVQSCSPTCAGTLRWRRSRSMALTPVKWLPLLAQTMRRPPGEPLVARVCAQTAGNPFFIEEVSGHLQDSADAAPATDPAEIPATIQQAVAHRVARLGSQAVALLTAGAVLGPEFDLELAAEIEGLPLDPAAARARARRPRRPDSRGARHARPFHIRARAGARRTRRVLDGIPSGAAARARRGGARTTRPARSRAPPRGSGPARARGRIPGG